MSLIIIRKEKELSKSTREEAIKLQIAIFETEILKLKGRKREEAMRTYRKLILPSMDEPIYLLRSE